MRLSDEIRKEFCKNWGWMLGYGIILLILGGLAIYFSSFSTMFSVIFLGTIILISGIVVTFDSFQFWWGRSSGFYFHLLMGILAIIIGISLMRWPVAGSITLTLFLGIFLMVIGILRIIYSISLQTPRWGYQLISGFLALILGILILEGWPATGLFVIGLFVGIDLFFLGLTYLMIGISAERICKANK